jgi:hypothetical protein
MKIDPQELQQLAQAGAPRFDIYAGIHKALRALMADTLVAVGRMDCDDALELAQVTERVMELLDFCLLHLDKENTFVHTAMEARAPGASEAIAHEHDGHSRHIAALAGVVGELRDAPAGTRFALQQRLYAELTLFVAENFQHMRVEETAHNAVLWARYTDDELHAIHDAIVGSIAPDRMMFAMRWLVPFMSPRERAGMLADVRAKAPAPAFQAIVDTVRPHLTAAEWHKLSAALGL